MKKTEETLTRRYALAFMNVVGDELDMEHAEALPAAAAQIEGARFFLLYAQFTLGNASSTRGLEEFFVEAGYKKIFVPLILLLTESKRLVLLPGILRKIYKLYLARQNIMHFTIESAVELTQQEIDSFVSFLRKETGKEIQYTLKLNLDLIAGVKIFSDTLGFENSIRQKLNRL